MQIGFALFNGLTVGMSIFLVAAGITLIFGMLKILNIAHGSFFMIGAYVAYSIIGTDPDSTWKLVVAAILSGLVLAALGLLLNASVFQRLRNIGEAYSLIATFALLMICNGVTKIIWGVNYHSVSAPDALAGAVMYGRFFAPSYSLFIIGLGVLTFLVLEIVVHRSSVGKVVRAIAHDPWMANLVGINTSRIYALVVIAAFFCVGMAGGLLLPNQSLSPLLFESYLLQSFIVVIIGGLGNIRGAFVGAIMLGLTEGANFLVLPDIPGILVYIILIGFLLWRPYGLFPQPGADTAGQAGSLAETEDVPATTPPKALLGSVVATVLAVSVLASMPFWANAGFLFIIGFAMVEAVLALSWNLLFGYAGLTTFGHAAFFALGAYFVGFLLRQETGIPFLVLLSSSLVLGALTAFFVGFIAIRRTSGIALGILTLSLGEILRRAINYSPALGSDDGLSGIPRPRIDLGLIVFDLGSERAYFWFLLAACSVVALALWSFTVGPKGRVLVALRQDPIRAEFLGINVRRYRLTAFVISGAIAALAGGLQAPWAQIVTPEAASYLHSTQPMLNTLLGGSGFFWGPIVGSAIFSGINYATRTLAGLSEVVSGGILLLIVLAAPGGVLGLGSRFGRMKHVGALHKRSTVNELTRIG
ncbi:ABC transporter permease [Microvirga puerhi]|uniref:ABC transporter permease n=1 Tax=Microvirga puerhi TaxID=2876078 RepID=A0ABS7VVA4_9HYPH|nr:ABC transporter permease [Microvirga puerhi]MBZ6079081.1 ABC transporter permease [Microvirga puerhi]